LGRLLFRARLRGSNEVPSVDTDASGTALFKFQFRGIFSRLLFAVRVRNIRNVRKIDLHLGRKGQVGPVVAVLFGPTTPGFSGTRTVRGTLRSGDLVGPLRGRSIFTLVRLMLRRRIYVNVHTTQHPTGEIRGQVLKVHRRRRRRNIT